MITNNGTSPAYGISVKDTPNAAVENVVAGQYVSKGWTPGDPTLEWYIPVLVAGDSAVLDYSGNITTTAVADGFVIASNNADIVRYLSSS